MTVHDAPTHHAPDPHEEGPGYQPRTLVLLGAESAHVHVLATLAQRPLIGVNVVLVAPHPRQIHAGMVAGFVAGHYPLDDCTLPLEPLVRQGGVRWLQRSVKALDAHAQTVLLDDGSTLHYDWLSVNTGPVQSRDHIDQALPGAREHGLFVRPLEAFGVLWPRVSELGATRPLRIAVIGAGTTGTTLALAIRQRLPAAAITLIGAEAPPGSHYPAKAQQRVLQTLRQRHITVLQDRAIGITADEVRLACGAGLACDVPVVAVGAQAPLWLSNSGLALNARGALAVDDRLRSTSHPQVFAAGSTTSHGDHPLQRHAVHAVRTGPALAHNLAAALAGSTLRQNPAHATPLNLLWCDMRCAMAVWGRFSTQGRWVWWLKDHLDRRYLARYTPKI